VSRNCDCQQQWWSGTRIECEGSIQVKRRRRRQSEQAQAAESLGPKGKWPGWDAPNSSHADVEPPAERRDPNTPVRQRNVVTPLFSWPPVQGGEESRSQEWPMGQRRGDRGESQRRPVIGRIEGASFPGQHPFTRKRAHFPVVFRHERTVANRPNGATQICRVGATSPGAVPSPKDWSAPGAYRGGGFRQVPEAVGLRWLRSFVGVSDATSCVRSVASHLAANAGRDLPRGSRPAMLDANQPHRCR